MRLKATDTRAYRVEALKIEQGAYRRGSGHRQKSVLLFTRSALVTSGTTVDWAIRNSTRGTSRSSRNCVRIEHGHHQARLHHGHQATKRRKHLRPRRENRARIRRQLVLRSRAACATSTLRPSSAATAIVASTITRPRMTMLS